MVTYLTLQAYVNVLGGWHKALLWYIWP